MSVYLGQTGAATYAGSALSNLRNIRWGAKRGTIDTTVKGDTTFQSKAGFVTRTVSFDALLDYVTGQKTVMDLIEVASPTVTAGTLVITVDTGKTFTYTTGAIYIGHEIVSPPGEAPVTVSFEFALIVPAVISWV
jgi:hypothetical protein